MKSQLGGSTDADAAGVVTPAPAAGRTDRTPGQMLRQERELRGLSLQQAADELNLDRWILEAIEVDQFQALGAPVYARGHLRKYAALLGLSQELIVGRYDSLTGTPEAPVVTTTTTAHMPRRSRRERTGRPALRWMLLTVLVVAVAAGAWWWLGAPRLRLMGHSFGNGSTGDSSIINGSAGSTAVAPPGGDATLTRPLAVPGESVAAGALASPLTSTSPTGAQSSVSAAGNPVNLHLEFTASAFVEAVDANGGRLMFETGKAGQARDLQGTPPLEVIVSVATAITLKVNDKPIVVPRLPGKEATRFTVNADGSVR